MFEIELDEHASRWFAKNEERARQVLLSYRVDYERSTMLPAPENVVSIPLGPAQPITLPYGSYPRLNLFKDLVCQGSGLSEAELKAPQRIPKAVVARAVLYHFARRYTDLSYPQIGRAVGRRNHTTIISALRRLARRPDLHQPLIAYVQARIRDTGACQ
ncbi:MAG: helix-turn-helix domain-containing protein [Bradyrhizobium sp.]|uniref:helix-turn-helix domain-containing protein n=1 Tax=Bradyrhizobium sp. TaxID=376 RepID=UPI003D0D2F43